MICVTKQTALYAGPHSLVPVANLGRDDGVKMPYKKPGGHHVVRTSRPIRSRPRQADSAVRRTTQHDTCSECDGRVSICSRNDVVEIQSDQLGGYTDSGNVRTSGPDQRHPRTTAELSETTSSRLASSLPSPSQVENVLLTKLTQAWKAFTILLTSNMGYAGKKNAWRRWAIMAKTMAALRKYSQVQRAQQHRSTENPSCQCLDRTHWSGRSLQV